MSLTSPIDWSELRLDTPEGFGLVRPRFLVEVFVEYSSPNAILDFYQQVLKEIGSAFRFVSTGSGNWSKRSTKTDSYLATWCANPVQWPKKVYCLVMQDVDEGIGNTELKLYYAARTKAPPNPEWFERLMRSDSAGAPRYYSTLSVSFALEHPLITTFDIGNWITHLAALNEPSFVSGSAGYAIDVPLNPPHPNQGPTARARGGALLQKHPGLDSASHLAFGLSLVKWDRPYMRAKGAAIPRPYVKRANWITMLNGAQVELLGGLEVLRKMLRVLPGIGIEQHGAAFLIRAGEQPQLGDISTGDVPAEYRVVAQAIKDVTLTMRDLEPEFGQDFDDYGLQVWYDALAKP